MPASPPLISLHGLTKTFPGVIANQEVDLALRGGEIHALLGENGAGKSTSGEDDLWRVESGFRGD